MMFQNVGYEPDEECNPDNARNATEDGCQRDHPAIVLDAQWLKRGEVKAEQNDWHQPNQRCPEAEPERILADEKEVEEFVH